MYQFLSQCRVTSSFLLLATALPEQSFYTHFAKASKRFIATKAMPKLQSTLFGACNTWLHVSSTVMVDFEVAACMVNCKYVKQLCTSKHLIYFFNQRAGSNGFILSAITCRRSSSM